MKHKIRSHTSVNLVKGHIVLKKTNRMLVLSLVLTLISCKPQNGGLVTLGTPTNFDYSLGSEAPNNIKEISWSRDSLTMPFGKTIAIESPINLVIFKFNKFLTNNAGIEYEYRVYNKPSDAITGSVTNTILWKPVFKERFQKIYLCSDVYVRPTGGSTLLIDHFNYGYLDNTNFHSADKKLVKWKISK